MRQIVGRWGHSLGIRISPEIADKVDLTEGDQVEITVHNGQGIMFEPVTLAIVPDPEEVSKARDVIKSLEPDDVPPVVELAGLKGK